MFNRNLTVSQSNNSVTYSLSLTCINSFNNCSIIKLLFGSNLWFFARKYLKYIFKPKNKISRLRGLNPFSFKGLSRDSVVITQFLACSKQHDTSPCQNHFLSCDGNMKFFIMATFLLLDN